ncbi:DUF2138 family protein [Leeia sp. TBRC 13508]|uniref:DUF2138 family protein n=1 Tax=Leeia speluncae TaxID=2884804 RepID=A0ABS8D9S0_9NEIS|nr:DUF2138 family protein [Leeia speluncae]MCB6184353.1 DUF2138 family protein [Leeia speluncae]
MAISRKAKVISTSVVLLVGSAIAVQAIWRPFSGFGTVNANQLAIDLSSPDMVIETKALSKIPSDMLKVPLLKDVLTEDFVFYYEQNESRLSISGALRRIAFEHNLTFSESLLNEVFNEPAEVALWRDESGKLKYWLLKVKRNNWAKLLQAAGNVAVSDSQLRQVSSLSVDGDDLPVFALNYGYNKSLLFAASSDQMLVLSDPGMLLAATPEELTASSTQKVSLDKDKSSFASAYLSKSGDAKDHYRQYFHLSKENQSDHQIATSADFLSFGYQSLFSGFEAVRFDFGKGGWKSSVMLDQTKLPEGGWNASAIWQSLPANPALCSSLPLHKATVNDVFKELMPDETEENRNAFINALNGQTAVCWYAKSSMASPLIIANLKSASAAKQSAPLLGRVFEKMIGASEVKNGAKFPVKTQKIGSATIWQRVVSARYGVAKANSLGAMSKNLSAARYFPVALAVSGDKVIFSPDRKLVDDVLSVMSHQYPSAADQVKRGDQTIVMSSPKQLAQLLQNETLAGLPADQEPVLRDVALQRLIPKLKVLAKYPSLSIQLSGTPHSDGWVETNWLFKSAK